MLVERKTAYPDNTQVQPQARLVGSTLVVDAFEYTYEGVSGAIPEIQLPLASDPNKEMVFLAICYEDNDTKERHVVTDSYEAKVPPTDVPLDPVMHNANSRRLFLVAQAVVYKAAQTIDDSTVHITVTNYYPAPPPPQEGV